MRVAQRVWGVHHVSNALRAKLVIYDWRVRSQYQKMIRILLDKYAAHFNE